MLVQHNAIEELDKRAKSVEEVNKTLNTRVESLESWNTKLSEELNKVADTLDANGVIVKESGEIKVLKKKLIDLETEIDGLKLRKTRNETSDKSGKEVVAKGIEKKCNACDLTFKTNSDFENHMVETHDAEKTFKCEVCGKMFLLAWRLRKHADS